MAILDTSYASGDDLAAKLRQGTIIYLAQQFTPTRAGKIDRIDIKIYKTGSPTGNVSVEIWSDNGSDLPNALLGGASANVDVSTLGADPGDFVTFTFTAANQPTIVASTKYWIVFAGDYTQDTNNCAQWRADSDESGGTSTGAVAAATAGPSWTDSGATVDRIFRQYYLPPSGGAFLNLLM